MDFFTLALGILLLLAVVDLSVGVSNDAVNFLNSAIGSRVARRRTILAVASAGVILGALFSSGIMEVARQGIFNPGMFTFQAVMIIFLAVMIADVLLLDLFNTFGLPTSTTVSIVFELLGAATVVALLVSLQEPGGASFLEYINGRNALTIVSGIVLSVGIAFAVGMTVQFLSRLMFTFDFAGRGLACVAWSAVALTLISWFLVVKGLKGASFVPPDWYAWVRSHAPATLAVMFAAWLVVAAAIRHSGRNPLAFVVLAGTFSLAMAFASNDLVNFIGVPLAGLESWRSWSASGAQPDAFLMAALQEPVRGDSLYLLGAGIVMAVTLWLSSKARTVTQTEVTLARQSEGAERFRPGPVSRGLVRVFLVFGEGLRLVAPSQWRTDIARRFEGGGKSPVAPDRPAFDLLRASVNLAVASILIAIATSMKLPLSTTFVTFMVAMGTSLADRAWGRDSAAYRVAGVLSVLTGWFATAAAAFVLAGLFAVLLWSLGTGALAALLALVGFALHRTFRYHGSRVQREARDYAADPEQYRLQVHLVQRQMSGLLEACARTIDLALRSLSAADYRLVDRAHAARTELKALVAEKDLAFVRLMKRIRPDADEQLLGHLEALACQQDFCQSVDTVVDIARAHVLNGHEAPTERVVALLAQFNERQQSLVRRQVSAWQHSGVDGGVERELRTLEALLQEATRTVVGELYAEVRPIKHTTLVLTLLTELADIVRELDRAHRLWTRHVLPDERSEDPGIPPDAATQGAS